jgi:hypothetical protein
MLTCIARPAVAADPTTRLLELLSSCDVGRADWNVVRVDLLLAIADGRSAREVAEILHGPRPCIGYASSYGAGAEEIVVVGAPGKGLGAMLWVDEGWWRGANLDVGWMSGVFATRRLGGAREIFVSISSGGSAGTIAATAFRLDGARATRIWDTRPALMELRDVKLIDDDHILIESRATDDPLFRWQAHAGWPGGSQRLYTRVGGRFVESGARQARDPFWVATGYVAGAFERSAAIMSRFATPDAVAAGLALSWPARSPSVSPLQLVSGSDLETREWASWDAIPSAARGAPPPGPAWGTMRMSSDGWRSDTTVVVRFDRDASGWSITGLWPLQPLSFDGTRLLP